VNISEQCLGEFHYADELKKNTKTAKTGLKPAKTVKNWPKTV
jgi:hypothetical protein